MEDVEKILGEVEALEGGSTLAATLRAEWEKSTKAASDLAKAEKAAKAAAAKAERERAQLADDLKAKDVSVDDRVKAAQAERDAAMATATRTALSVAVADALGIADKARRRRAVEAFLADYMPEDAVLGKAGELEGADEALATFRKNEAFWFVDEAGAEGHGGGRGGSEKTPIGAKPGGKIEGPEAIASVQNRLMARYPKRAGA